MVRNYGASFIRPIIATSIWLFFRELCNTRLLSKPTVPTGPHVDELNRPMTGLNHDVASLLLPTPLKATSPPPTLSALENLKRRGQLIIYICGYFKICLFTCTDKVSQFLSRHNFSKAQIFKGHNSIKSVGGVCTSSDSAV